MAGYRINYPPGGVSSPWNEQPPNNGTGGQPVYHNPIGYLPGQLPQDPGNGTGSPEPGDSQIGYPEAPVTPAAPTYTFEGGSPLVVTYLESGASYSAANDAFANPPLRIYLGANAAGPTVPGSLRFVFRGRTYVDRAGSLYYDIDPLTNAGTLGGTFDYSANVATLTDYASGSNTVTIHSMCTRYAETGVDGILFRTNGAPLREGAFTLRATTMTGDELIASVDVNGVITGAQMLGKIDWQTGLARVAFGERVTAAGNESAPWYDADLIDGDGKIWRPTRVDPASIFFGAVVYKSIPADPELIGIDPVRLPNDGRVPGFNPGRIAVVSHTAVTDVPSPTAGGTTDLGRERIGFIEITDAEGEAIDSIWYTLDPQAGEVTWANPLNLSAYTMPVRIRHRIQDIALVTDVAVTGHVTLSVPVTHDYPAGAVLSSALEWVDMQARYNNLFDQQTYSAGTWSDELVGAPAAASYNDVTYPIAVSNRGAIDERWAIVFVNTTTVNVIGETVGQVLSGVGIDADIAPINPVTISDDNPGGTPYFTIDADGWGSGWAAGNVLRFNTVSATRPMWLARVVTPGEIDVANDAVRLQTYGNAH